MTPGCHSNQARSTRTICKSRSFRTRPMAPGLYCARSSGHSAAECPVSRPKNLFGIVSSHQRGKSGQQPDRIRSRCRSAGVTCRLTTGITGFDLNASRRQEQMAGGLRLELDGTGRGLKAVVNRQMLWDVGRQAQLLPARRDDTGFVCPALREG